MEEREERVRAAATAAAVAKERGGGRYKASKMPAWSSFLCLPAPPASLPACLLARPLPSRRLPPSFSLPLPLALWSYSGHPSPSTTRAPTHPGRHSTMGLVCAWQRCQRMPLAMGALAKTNRTHTHTHTCAWPPASPRFRKKGVLGQVFQSRIFSRIEFFRPKTSFASVRIRKSRRPETLTVHGL